MIQVSNKYIYNDLEFGDYLNIDGYSYSGLKNEGKVFVPTQKMRLGTQIHNFLLEPTKYKPETTHELVKSVSGKVLEMFGSYWDLLQCEVSTIATFEMSNGLSIPYKGRLDIYLPNVAVIDLKVSELPLSQSIPHFGYNHQLSGYGISTGIETLFIIRVHPKTKQIEIKKIPLIQDFWIDAIITKGQVFA